MAAAEVTAPGNTAASRSDAIIASVGDGITVQDKDYRIIYQNQTMKSVFGDCVGRTCYETYKQLSDVCPGCPVSTCFSSGEVHTVERIVAIGEKTFVFETCASPIRDANGIIVAAVEVVRNATERKEAEDKITKLKNLYYALSRTNKAILHSIHRDFLFRDICRIAVDYGKLSLAVIGMVNPETNLITPVAHCGRAADYLSLLTVSVDADREEGRGPTGIAMRNGVPYVCNNFHDDPATKLWQAAALACGIYSSAAFPIVLEGDTIGVLKVYSDQRDFFDEDIVTLFQEMVDNVGFAIKGFSREEKRRQAEFALQDSEERLKRVIEGSNDGYWDWDIESGTVNLSDRFITMLGSGHGEIPSTIAAIMNLVHPEDKPRMRSVVYSQLVTTSAAFEIELRLVTTADGYDWFLFRGKVVTRDGDGVPLWVSGVASNITDKKRQEERLHYLSTHDSLSGLFNRAYFDAEMARVVQSRQYPISIVLADIDGLKHVNDTFGHTDGDRLIKQAAMVLQQAFRGEDVVVRLGGDEFAIILQNADTSAVKEAIKRVFTSQEVVNKDNKEYSLSISLGSATAESSAQLSDALKLADSRMYYYKNRRKQKGSKPDIKLMNDTTPPVTSPDCAIENGCF